MRLELHVPPNSNTTTSDNLFLELQEILFLRPYHPRNAMLALNPSLYEVAVCVDNFWSANESGGNSGRPIRRGTVYVTGESEALRRLRGDKDTRFTRRGAGFGNSDGSGVRGLTHTLQGQIKLRRMRTQELSSTTVFTTRWVCVDYSTTHVFYCTAAPKCALRSGREPAVVNNTCLHLDELYLERKHDNIHDANAIAVVCKSSGRLVGFVPREIAACLAPGLDDGIVTASRKGVYSDVEVGGDPHHRVWFRIDAGVGVEAGGLLRKNLDAIPWWVQDDIVE